MRYLVFILAYIAVHTLIAQTDCFRRLEFSQRINDMGNRAEQEVKLYYQEIIKYRTADANTRARIKNSIGEFWVNPNRPLVIDHLNGDSQISLDRFLDNNREHQIGLRIRDDLFVRQFQVKWEEVEGQNVNARVGFIYEVELFVGYTRKKEYVLFDNSPLQDINGNPTGNNLDKIVSISTDLRDFTENELELSQNFIFRPKCYMEFTRYERPKPNIYSEEPAKEELKDVTDKVLKRLYENLSKTSTDDGQDLSTEEEEILDQLVSDNQQVYNHYSNTTSTFKVYLEDIKSNSIKKIEFYEDNFVVNRSFCLYRLVGGTLNRDGFLFETDIFIDNQESVREVVLIDAESRQVVAMDKKDKETPITSITNLPNIQILDIEQFDANEVIDYKLSIVGKEKILEKPFKNGDELKFQWTGGRTEELTIELLDNNKVRYPSNPFERTGQEISWKIPKSDLNGERLLGRNFQIAIYQNSSLNSDRTLDFRIKKRNNWLWHVPWITFVLLSIIDWQVTDIPILPFEPNTSFNNIDKPSPPCPPGVDNCN